MAIVAAVAAGGLYLQFADVDIGTSNKQQDILEMSVDSRSNRVQSQLFSETTKMASVDNRYARDHVAYAIRTQQISEDVNNKFAAINLSREGDTKLIIPTITTKLNLLAIPASSRKWHNALSTHPNLTHDGGIIDENANQFNYREPYGDNNANPSLGFTERIHSSVRYGTPFGPGGKLNIPLNDFAADHAGARFPHLAKQLKGYRKPIRK